MRGDIMRYFRCIFFLLLYSPAVFAQQQPTILADDTTTVVKREVVLVRKKADRISPYLLDTLQQQVPLARALFHDKIDNEQARADVADGLADHHISLPASYEDGARISRALLDEVDRLEIMVENMPANGRDSVMCNQQKIQSLRALWELLRQYSIDPRPTADYYTHLASNMRDMLLAANEHKSLDYVQAHPDFYALDNGKVLLDNQPEARSFLYTYLGKAHPVRLIMRLEDCAKDSFASGIISAAARLQPKIVFNYALSSNMLLKGAVYRTHDPFVQAIVQLTAESGSPLRALPFVSYLYNNTKTIDAIDTIAANPALAFDNLVSLRMQNEPLTKALYTEELEYTALKNFVRHMNELHDTTDDVRFKCIDSLSANALFYIMVYGREEIYTSSFLGTFNRMMARMAPLKGNQLLEGLHYDHFRTFIRLCAGYNTLSEFLATMDDTARTTLMSRFIGGLQYGPEQDLEDAVNVADAFGSIQDSALFVFLDAKVKENYYNCTAQKNKKGIAIYHLLSMLLESSRLAGTDPGGASAKLKIKPINIVPFEVLANDSGTIYERVFFYGDDDGKTAYSGFLDEYLRNPKWKTDTTRKYWTTVTSQTGKRIVMYANRPLKSPEDEMAIDSLDLYLYTNAIKPTIAIHRGHSYHVKSTLSRLDTNAKIVVLGSCGGYHNVATVLSSSPDAHIISSKQTGVGAINEPIIRTLNAQLQEGGDINWITAWQTLDEYFLKRKELYAKFNDYIPPHKNLGVIFIKAYRQMVL